MDNPLLVFACWGPGFRSTSFPRSSSKVHKNVSSEMLLLDFKMPYGMALHCNAHRILIPKRGQHIRILADVYITSHWWCATRGKKDDRVWTRGTEEICCTSAEVNHVINSLLWL